MRIEQPLDASQGQAVLQHRVSSSPPPDAARRVQAVGQSPGSDQGSKVPTAPPDDAVFLDLSPEGREAARKAAIDALQQKLAGQVGADGRPAEDSAEAQKDAQRLADLSARDQQVRAHEQTVRALAGHRVVQIASYSYKVGPDGRLYVVDGEISFDTTAVPGDPEATLRKAEQLRRAALVPGQGGDDQAVAVAAAALAAQARAELLKQQNLKEG